MKNQKFMLIFIVRVFKVKYSDEILLPFFIADVAWQFEIPLTTFFFYFNFPFWMPLFLPVLNPFVPTVPWVKKNQMTLSTNQHRYSKFT